jgi:glycine oxidase
LAGTALAWCLREAGQRVLLLDNDTASTSSKIAAGLITPVTGQRMTVSETFAPTYAAAHAFYRTAEQATGQRFFHVRPAIRLFRSDAERATWDARRTHPTVQAVTATRVPQPSLAEALAETLPADVADTSGGGFIMPEAAQLDVPAYLAASRGVLPYQQMALDWSRDVTFEADAVRIKALRSRLLISCEGFAAARNPYLSWLPFKAAKGDVLTVRFARPLPAVTLHRAIWIAPTADAQVFRVGSSYDWDTLDHIPSASARAEIEAKLQAFIRVPYSVIDHHAAVRPILVDIKPAVGLHPRLPRLGYFNGLGSKGSLVAPWYAQRFAQFLLQHVPLPEDGLSRATAAAATATVRIPTEPDCA